MEEHPWELKLPHEKEEWADAAKYCKILQVICEHLSTILQVICEHLSTILQVICEHLSTILRYVDGRIHLGSESTFYNDNVGSRCKKTAA